MKVRKISVEPVQDIEGEEYRFHVPSDTFGQPSYLVNLIAHDGNGQCDCADYSCKRNIDRKKGETAFFLISCKHQRRALLHWARKEIKQRVRMLKQKGLYDEAD